MEFVDPENEPSSFREPPAPDDRLWRHPSELAADSPSGALSGATGPNGLRQPPNTWAVAGISALIAGLVSAGMVVAVIGTRDPSGSSALPVERQLVRPRTAPTIAASPVVEMAERLRPAIVQLKVERGDRTAGGTGVVFRSDGHVLTNAQLVAGASAIKAVTANGRELNVRLVGVDPETDTGVVKLDGGPFPVATLGSAVDLRVGQPAVAVGLPVGVAGGPSVTGGMISALHREIRLQTVETGVENLGSQGAGIVLVDMIQTDAPIPPGSSGGALLDTNGAVIGITTTAGVAESAGAFAFATAIDVARSVADELIRTGRVVHSWLGVEGADVDGTTAAELDLEGGAMVVRVKPGSPAERGGLEARDVIVALEGQPVGSMGEVVATLRSHDPGDTIGIEVVRDRRHRTLVVTLVERPPTS